MYPVMVTCGKNETSYSDFVAGGNRRPRFKALVLKKGRSSVRPFLFPPIRSDHPIVPANGKTAPAPRARIVISLPGSPSFNPE